jgi:hypothetical protein
MALKGNQVMTELNVASNELGLKGYNDGYPDPDTSGVIALADVIPNMGAILSVNLLKNSIGVDQAKYLVIILKEHPTLKSLCGNKGNETELDMSSKMNGAEDAIMLAAEIVGNRAMTSLHVGMNSIPQKEMKEIITIAMCMDSMKILCDVPIKDRALTELDVSGKNLGMEGALVVAEYLRDNGALTSLNLASNGLGTMVLPEGWQQTRLTEWTHTSSKATANPGKPDGIIALANAIPGMGALSKLDVRNNDINAEGKRALKKAAGVGVFSSR